MKERCQAPRITSKRLQEVVLDFFRYLDEDCRQEHVGRCMCCKHCHHHMCWQQPRSTIPRAHFVCTL